MKPNRAVLAVLVPVSLYALGCGEDVGACPSDSAGMTKGAGYDTVVVGSQVQYGGQAIINQSCANGICHSSAAKGEARHGAPADLNFDLRPVGESGVESSATTNGRTVAKLKEAEVRGLRERQRKVFEERNSIWQQVKDGEMPPSGMFAAFRKLASIFDSDELTPCTRVTNGYGDITTKASQDILRTWLACSVPIVEVNSSVVELPGSAGTAGYQYQLCGGNTVVPDGGTPDAGGGVVTVPVTLKDLLADNGAFGVYTCATCHPAAAPKVKLDLTDETKAYNTLVNDKTVICNGKPYVTVGDPTKSFLIDTISKADPGCGKDRMPLGQEMTAAEIQKVSDWIKGGAKRSTDKSLGGLNTGLDAGVP
jgi:hypothetical protein